MKSALNFSKNKPSLSKQYFEFQSLVLSILLQNWVNLLGSILFENARTCKDLQRGFFSETRLLSEGLKCKHCGHNKQHTVCKTCKKLPINDFLPIGSSGWKGLSVSNCSVTLAFGGKSGN